MLRGSLQHHHEIAYIFAGSATDTLSDMFTSSRSPFYQAAHILEVGPIPHEDMKAFLLKLFAKGGRKLDASVLASFFSIAGENPNDLQHFAFHLWTHSRPGPIGLPELRESLVTLMAEIGRAGERVFGEATLAQQRLLFALALCEGELDVFGQEFRALAGFKTHQAVAFAIKPFLKGTAAVLDKHGSKVRFRERYMRLWALTRVLRNPRMLPAGVAHESVWVQRIRPYLSTLLQ